MPIGDKAESRVSPRLFLRQVLILRKKENDLSASQLTTGIVNWKYVLFKKGHRNQKGGCPDTLDTPPGSAPVGVMLV